MNYLKDWFGRFLWVFVLIFSLFCVVVAPVFMVLDHVLPWQEEVANLSSQQPHKFRLLVGFTGFSRTYSEGGSYNQRKRREWILFPSVFTSPDTYEYIRHKTKDAKGQIDVSTTKNVNRNGAIHYLLVYLVAYVLFGFVLYPKIKRWCVRRSYTTEKTDA